MPLFAASFLAFKDFDAEVKGLDAFAPEDRPPVGVVHVALQENFRQTSTDQFADAKLPLRRSFVHISAVACHRADLRRGASYRKHALQSRVSRIMQNSTNQGDEECPNCRVLLSRAPRGAWAAC